MVKGQSIRRASKLGQKRGFFEFRGKTHRCDTTRGSNVIVPKNFLIRVRMQKLCPFYKFQRYFANKVKIHICKFSQQVDHISHGKLFFSHFYHFLLFFLNWKRRSGGLQLVKFWAKLVMMHRGSGAPLLVQLVMAHHSRGAPLLVLKKIKKIENFLLMAHRGCGAPLIVKLLMAHYPLMRH